MKAEELSPNCWVRFREKNYKVVMVDSGCEVGGLDGIELCPIEDWQPIELTEEWLLRLDFEEQMKWTYRIHLRGNMYLVYYLGEKGWSIGNKNYSDFPCKHVHKLQQLIKSLKE